MLQHLERFRRQLGDRLGLVVLQLTGSFYHGAAERIRHPRRKAARESKCAPASVFIETRHNYRRSTALGRRLREGSNSLHQRYATLRQRASGRKNTKTCDFL